MSDRDLKLLIKIIRFMQQHPQAHVSQGVVQDDVDERLSALLNAEISEENIPLSQTQNTQGFDHSLPNSTVQVKGGENEVFEQLTEENEALKEQVSSMSEMMEMTLKHVDSKFDKKLDEERKQLKEIEEGLQEQITSQQEMMEMAIKYVDDSCNDKFETERKAFKELEQNLQEQIDAQQGMLEITLKNVDIVFEEQLDKERKYLKTIEEELQEQIISQQGMMEMTIKHMLQNYRSKKEVDTILTEYKVIENNLQEQIASQQEMMEITINYLQNELTSSRELNQDNPETENLIQEENSTTTDANSLEQAENTATTIGVNIREQAENIEESSTTLKTSANTPEQAEITDENTTHEHIPEVTNTIEQTIDDKLATTSEHSEMPDVKYEDNDAQTINVAHKVFNEYLDLPSKLNNKFKAHFIAEFMHKGNSRAYLYVRPLRNNTFIVLVDSLLEGVSSIVFNSLSSMLLHHLIVERRIENIAEFIKEFLQGSTSVYESMGEAARDCKVSILSIDKSTLEMEFASTGNSLFYGYKNKYRVVSSGKTSKRKINHTDYQISRVNGKKDAVVYMCSQSLEETYEKEGGGNFMSLNEMLINTYQLDFTEQKDNLSGYMQELQPENQADNTLIFGLNL